MRALVTGAAGFVGQWLCRELLHRGVHVHGALFEAEPPPGALSPDERRHVQWIHADVRLLDHCRRLVDESEPGAIFHLAGVAYLPAANADPGAALEVNVLAAARLLGEVRERRRAGTLDPVVLIVGSGEQYGRHDESEQPLRECVEQRPASVYAASKAAQEVIALEAFRSAGVRVIATRSFNHSGPWQSDQFVLPALVGRALRLRQTGERSLRLGNTATVRDFSHVADVARAYALLVERGAPGEVYNVASGHGVEMATLARQILARVGVDAKLEVDPALVRPVDVPVLIGDAGKLRAATGWSPERSSDTIIEDLIRATTR